ncbi:MAG: hypothetical protein Q8811_02800, partial [Candidatus Phytoplasma australasiaticum]|nr:hypothetical protein [Candidatus Phytoplasma australasiaticum]
YESLGFLRNKLAKDLNLIDPQKLSLLWIIDFPLLILSLKSIDTLPNIASFLQLVADMGKSARVQPHTNSMCVYIYSLRPFLLVKI